MPFARAAFSLNLFSLSQSVNDAPLSRWEWTKQGDLREAQLSAFNP